MSCGLDCRCGVYTYCWVWYELWTGLWVWSVHLLLGVVWAVDWTTGDKCMPNIVCGMSCGLDCWYGMYSYYWVQCALWTGLWICSVYLPLGTVWAVDWTMGVECTYHHVWCELWTVLWVWSVYIPLGAVWAVDWTVGVEGLGRAGWSVTNRSHLSVT